MDKDKQQQIRLHQQKWKKWNQQRKRDQLKKKVNFQDNLQSYAVQIAQKLSDPNAYLEKQKDIMSKQIGNQIQSNICGICLQLMVPPHNPMILFPCGHNVCKFCLFKDGHLDKRVYALELQKCHMCRVRIQSYTLNRNLMTLICTYTNNKHLLQKEIQRQKKMAEMRADEQNIDKLRVRCKILQNEKQILKKQLNEYKKQIKVLDQVVGTLKKQKKRNQQQIQVLQQQGKLIRKHLDNKQEQSDKLRKKGKEVQEKLNMIDKALTPLTMQKQKMQLLQVAKILERTSLK